MPPATWSGLVSAGMGQRPCHDKYSLPGGGMEQGEAALTAACRELGEEPGIKAHRAERLFDYNNEASFNDHKVVLVFAGGEPRINERELESFRWWDGRERLSVYPHVTSIIARYEAPRPQAQ